MNRLPQKSLNSLAIVTETFSPDNNGIATTLSQLAEGLYAQGVNIQVIRPQRFSQEQDHYQRSEIQTHCLPGLPLPGYKNIKFGLPNYTYLLRLWERQPPSIIYVATVGPLGLTALKAATKLNIPVLTGMHTQFYRYFNDYHLNLFKPLIMRYLRFFHNLTAGTLAPSQSQMESLKQQGFKHIDYLTPGVDSLAFSPSHRCMTLRQRWGLRHDDIALLYAAPLTTIEHRRLNTALEAYDHVRALLPAIKFIVIGEGPMTRELSLEHPDVILCGQPTNHELARHYASCDIFLLPNKTDAFGYEIMEAMASGLAVVSFDSPAAQAHIKNKETGLIVKSSTPQAFAQTLSLLCNNSLELETLKSKAHLQARSLDWQHIVDEFVTKLLYHMKRYHRQQSMKQSSTDQPPQGIKALTQKINPLKN